MSGLLDKLEIAKVLLHRCERELLKRGPGGGELGVTIIVHARELGPHDAEKAVVTTLPSRMHQRVILGQAVVQSLEMDGVAGDMGELVEREYALIFGEDA